MLSYIYKCIIEINIYIMCGICCVPIELIESAMYLYRATGDPFLHEVAIDILESIERQTKTKCGYATVRSHLILLFTTQIT